MSQSPFQGHAGKALSGPQAQRLFQHSQDLFCVANMTGHFVLVNPAFTRLLVYSAEELYAKPVVDFVHPDDRQATIQQLALLQRGEKKPNFENRYLTADGRWVRLSWRSILDESDGLIYASARDVTEEHQQRVLLQLAHEELQAQSEELQAQSEELQAQTDALTAQGQKLELLNEALKERNQSVEAEVLARTAELQAAHDDLLALNVQLSSMRELKARILDTVPSGIAFLDPQLVFRWANRAYQTPDFQGGPVAGLSVDVVHPRIAPGLKPLFLKVLEGGEPFRMDGVTFNPPGAAVQRHWDISVLPARDEEGAVDGLLCIVDEVTDRVERERLQEAQLKQLKEIDALKDEFLAVISHECRTPIHAIMGFASALGDEVLGPLTPEQRRSIHRILQGSDRLLALIDDLLDMSSIQAGKFLLAHSEVHPRMLGEEVLADLSPLAAAKGHQLELSIADKLGPFQGDGTRLLQALSNLLSNAIKFTKSAGTITLSIYQEGGLLCFMVKDPGPGISEADQKRLFQRFTQLDMSATRSSGGTGLGLSIVKAIAEAHGGSVGLESQLGHGASFFMRIPIEAPQA